MRVRNTYSFLLPLVGSNPHDCGIQSEFVSDFNLPGATLF